MYEHCKEVIAYPCASDSAETPDLSDDSEDFDDDSDCIEPDEQTPASISRRSFLWDLAVGVTAGLAVGAVGEGAVEYLYDRFERIGPNDSVEMTLGNYEIGRASCRERV